MRVFWRPKLVLGALLVLAIAIAGAVSHANQILTGVIPVYLARVLKGKVTLDRAAGSLFAGIRVFGLKYYPETPQGITEAPVLSMRELRIGCNVFKSLTSPDRWITVTAIEPRIETDVDTILVDPAALLALPAVLKQHGVHVSFAARDGKSILTGANIQKLEFDWELEGTITPDGLLTVTAPAQHAVISALLEGQLDLIARAGSANLAFASTWFSQNPLKAAGWSYGTPIEGRANAKLTIARPDSPVLAGSLRVPFGPRLKLDVKPEGTLVARAGVLENAERGVRVIGVALSGAFDRDGLRLTDGQIPLAGGRVSPSGTVQGWDPARAHLELALHDLDAAQTPGLEQFTTAGRVSGRAVIVPGAPVALSIDATSPSGPKYAFDKAHIEMAWAGDRITIQKLDARAAGGTGIATGTVDLGGAKHFEIDAKFQRFPHAAFKALLTDLDLQDGVFTGTLSGAAKLAPFESEHWEWDFKIEKPSIHNFTGATGVLVGSYEDGTTQLTRLELARPGAWDSARFELEKGKQNAFKLRGVVKGLDLAKVTSGLTGEADFGLAVGLVNGRLVENVKGEVRDFGARGSKRPVEALSFKIAGAAKGGHDVDITDKRSFQVSARLPEVTGTDVSLATLLAKPVHGSFRVQELAPFAQLFRFGKSDTIQDGQVEGQFEASLNDGLLAVDAHVDKLALATAHGPFAAQDFHVKWDGKSATLEGVRARWRSAPVQLGGEVSADAADLEIKVADLPIVVPVGEAPPARPGRKAEAPPTLRAALAAAARIKGPLARPAIEANLALTDLALPGGIDGGMKTELRGRLSYRDGRAYLVNGQLKTGDVSCPVSGSAPVRVDLKAGVMEPGDGALDLALQFPRTDAALLAVLAPTMVSGAKGTVQMALKVGGTWDEPHVDGAVDVDAKVLKMGQNAPPLTDAKVQLTFDHDRIAIRRLTATMMGGDLVVSGAMPLRNASGRYDLKGKLTGVRHRTPFVDLTDVDTELTVTGDARAPVIGGLVKFDKGQINLAARDEDEGMTLKELLAGLPLRDPTLNVKMDVPSKLFIKSSQLDAEMKGALVLAGKPADYRIRGELEMVRGSIFFQGRRIRVSEGSIKFRRPQREDFISFSDLDDPTSKKLDTTVDAPYVSLSGQTEIDGVRIFVDAKGFAVDNGLKVTVRSIPPMEESQILAALVTGRATFSDLQGKEVPSLLQNSVANQVAGTLVDRKVESAVQKALGFDDFRLSSGLLQSGPQDQRQRPSVSVGKYINKNVYIAADGAWNGDNSGFLQRVELDLKLDKTLAVTVEKALTDTPVSGNVFDRTNYQGITANETRWGISKQLKW